MQDNTWGMRVVDFGGVDYVLFSEVAKWLPLGSGTLEVPVALTIRRRDGKSYITLAQAIQVLSSQGGSDKDREHYYN